MSEVTIVFRDAAGRESYTQLPWVAGRDLKQYLREPVLRSYHLVGRVLRSKVLGNNRRKVRLTTVLEEGETVHIVPVARALS